MKSSLHKGLLTAVLVAVLGCTTTTPHAVKLPPPSETNSLGPGDVFEVYVYEEPSLSKAFKVAPNGTIDFPLIGTVEVEGKEAQEVAETIKVRLRDAKILKNPSVSILVKEVNSKKVTIFGQVSKPGQLQMVEGLTLLQAITLAGGFTPLADRDRVALTRKINKKKAVRVIVSAAAITDGKMADVPLQAGDTIYVEERIF